MNRIRWGIIGCGDVARKRVANAIKGEPRSQLVASCRRNETNLREFCQEFAIDRSYTNADELITDPEVDAVYIATPVRDHLPQTLAAASAGKHVLVEKPMAMSVRECDHMIAACREAGVKLGVAYYRRFYPLVHRMQHLIEDGEIGTPMAVSALTATLPLQPSQEGYWRVIPKLGGGGALMDIGSHRINIFLNLFGEIDDVKSHCVRVTADYEAEVTALLSLKFQSGLVGTLQCHFGSTSDPDEFAVLGTQGRLLARPLNGDDLIVDANGQQRIEKHPPAENLCGPLVSDFVLAVLENREPAVSGAEGLATNLVIQRAYGDADSLGV